MWHFSYIMQMTRTTKLVVVETLCPKVSTRPSQHLSIPQFQQFTIDFLIRIMEHLKVVCHVSLHFERASNV
jgi:hypothetical protein